MAENAHKPESLLAAPDQAPQSQINQEIKDIHELTLARWQKEEAEGTRTQGPTLYDFTPYRSSVLRHPTKNPKLVDPETIELTSPAFGQRMVITGRVLDGWGRPVRNQLVEIWQANAAGRYIHQRDQHPAPLDPNFTGAGRCITDDDGWYRFVTIKPGAYPWKNHNNAWRPAHIHFSLFGSAFTQRLVTQCYFPGDPLFALDPIYQTIPDQRDRDRLVATYDHDLTVPEFMLGFRWDIVLTGKHATWFEPEGDH